MRYALRALAIAAALALASPVEAAALNIVALGASNTAGWGVGIENAFPTVLEKLLREKGIDASVANAGIPGDITAGMLSRLDSAVPDGTDIVILQPGDNDTRFFRTKEQRATNIAEIENRLEARGIRVIVVDPQIVPPEDYQWDHIHFTAAAHAKIAARLAAAIAAAPTTPQAVPEPSAPQPPPGKR
jgi:acyl-CoA thioesterase I